MALDPQFLTVCRMAGLTDRSRFSFRTTHALHKLAEITLADSNTLVQVICLVSDQPMAWGLVKPAFSKLVEDQPGLKVYYALAAQGAAEAARKTRFQGDGRI